MSWGGEEGGYRKEEHMATWPRAEGGGNVVFHDSDSASCKKLRFVAQLGQTKDPRPRA